MDNLYPPDEGIYRQTLGHYPTGVAVVTAMKPDGTPTGMTVGSFTSVSLDPPLIAFLPSKTSSSWAALRECGDTFGVNILAADQEVVCRRIASSGNDKFNAVAWHESPLGLPILDGCVAYLECRVSEVRDAGDHDLVLGEVVQMGVQRPTESLLFFRGGYGSFRPRSLAIGTPQLFEQLRFVDAARPIIERLASDSGHEITALVLHEGDLITTAAANDGSHMSRLRVGRRTPFLPPVGAVHAAYSPESVRNYWLSQLPKDATDEAQRAERMLDTIRERGFGFTVGHTVGRAIESMGQRRSRDPSPEALREFREVIRRASANYNIEFLSPQREHEFHAATAPVFHPQHGLAFTLTLWGHGGSVSYDTMRATIDQLVHTARVCSDALSYVDSES
ncbi:flavin reductase [Flexivirga oryzae]|uniref:Flavin reductase (DIM6/NTAB) family NADH-FMN oxidoreductase RutF n=1 Tax=Flexivirga oryzae TaxID=1794944 RepID=A0A839NDZ4_9MICO|nr:flavin reductase [Flexivirga oryzae]MBB2893846.1 flavin reductase (DIM6/NTAB) family NADH-FMN oxidoreductase RutF [Flexivirga oryzae]